MGSPRPWFCAWFCKYENYDGGDVFLGDDRKAKISVHGKFKLKLQGGRTITLLGVLHILSLAINLISISKIDDESVKNVFDKNTYKMARGALVLMWGVRIETLDRVLGSTAIDVCNNSTVLESGAENLFVSRENTMLCRERLASIGEKGF